MSSSMKLASLEYDLRYGVSYWFVANNWVIPDTDQLPPDTGGVGISFRIIRFIGGH